MTYLQDIIFPINNNLYHQMDAEKWVDFGSPSQHRPANILHKQQTSLASIRRHSLRSCSVNDAACSLVLVVSLSFVLFLSKASWSWRIQSMGTGSTALQVHYRQPAQSSKGINLSKSVSLKVHQPILLWLHCPSLLTTILPVSEPSLQHSQHYSLLPMLHHLCSLKWSRGSHCCEPPNKYITSHWQRCFSKVKMLNASSRSHVEQLQLTFNLVWSTSKQYQIHLTPIINHAKAVARKLGCHKRSQPRLLLGTPIPSWIP
jgi:hypothetical protein